MKSPHRTAIGAADDLPEQLKREEAVRRLKEAWTLGIESGPSQAFDIDEIKRYARERFRQKSTD